MRLLFQYLLLVIYQVIQIIKVSVDKLWSKEMKIVFVLAGLLSTPLFVSSALAEICGPDHEHEEDKQKQDK